MKKKIVFRSHGSKKIGIGHISRCLSLAKAINQLDPSIEIFFLINADNPLQIQEYNCIYSSNFNATDIEIYNEIQPNLIIIDSYYITSEYIKSISNISQIAYFDDNNDILEDLNVDFLINGNIHSQNLSYLSSNPNINYLVGPKYLIMKKDYWNCDIIQNNQPNGIMMTIGGADPCNLMPKFISFLKKTNMKKRIIIGPSFQSDQIEIIEKMIDQNFELIYKPKSLKQYILESELVISATGSTIYEILSLKRIPIIFYFAPNQKLICEFLEKEGVPSFGNITEIDFFQKNQFLTDIYSNKLNIQRKIKPLFKIFDGKGALRVAKYLITHL